LFIFDLKDIFISIFEGLFIRMVIFNYKGIRKINEKILYQEFKVFIKSELMTVVSKANHSLLDGIGGFL
jgi:hypothetical protein